MTNEASQVDHAVAVGDRTEEMESLGIRRVQMDMFYVGIYRYTNLDDAIAEAKRSQERPGT